ncbi:helix-turn-helix transcriptional regulator [Phreatobacter sp. AB_2022a]|uniref:helix-turn-helix transcriptional regulator n=1 Tax=Phreatobacter sp. AB_2022a TaxID=3003134 RepID=UPI0022873A03|nr:WYL domain-containing protein [Phreatobacter sp. AB_2022a]MCZ0733988.1 WYL domain-containing protein [Phreatobacter sp. AB_2022a]
MRASRLLSILNTLQARGQVTAPALAEALEVSVRTVYRDIDALSAAGVPVYAERGAEGGYRLVDGYRVRLNGLSPREAEALFLGGLGDAAEDLGLGAAAAAAQIKLLAALPQEQRASAEQMRARFHLDAPGWFTDADRPAHLGAMADAVWRQRRLRIRYRSWKGEVERIVDPLGIVMKAGAWYMVGAVDGSVRTFRIGRVEALEVIAEGFVRPSGFDLATYWKASTERLDAELYPHVAVVRLSPLGLRILTSVSPPFVRAGLELDAPGPDGWRQARLPVGPYQQAVYDLARLGPEVEVLEPAEFRAGLAELLARAAALYRTRRGRPSRAGGQGALRARRA